MRVNLRAMRSLFVPAFFLGATALVASACGVEETKYASPEGLKGKEVPPPSTPIAAGGSGDAGDTAALCDGGAPVGDANCAVKWSTGVYALIQNTWKCTNADCHLETAGSSVFAPAISGTDPSRAWTQLVETTIGGKRYVDPCSKDESVSAMKCNLDTPKSCGVAQMPETGRGLAVSYATATDLATLVTWLKCGAPNN